MGIEYFTKEEEVEPWVTNLREHILNEKSDLKFEIPADLSESELFYDFVSFLRTNVGSPDYSERNILVKPSTLNGSRVIVAHVGSGSVRMSHYIPYLPMNIHLIGTRTVTLSVKDLSRAIPDSVIK